MRDPRLEAVKGQILWSSLNKNVGNIPAHNIVFLGPSEDKMLFIGAMITHSPGFGNLAMAMEHFIAPDKTNGYRVGYDKSFVVKVRLLKLMEWAPFEPVGMLSEAGINFLEVNIGETKPEFFSKNAPI